MIEPMKDFWSLFKKATVKTNSNRVSIDLTGNTINDANLNTLLVFQDLRELSLIGSPITDAGVSQLKKLPPA